MERFCRVLFIFCILPLPFLYALQYVVDSGLKKSHGELFAEWNDIYSGQASSDILIMGSSRAWVQYSPKVIEQATGLSTYNIGLDGNPFPMQDARFQIYLQHNKAPKYIIQNLDNSFLNRSPELYESEQYLPYVSDPIIRKATEGYKGSFDWTQRDVPMFKYNNQSRLVLDGIENYLGRVNPSVKYKGFEAQDMEWDSSFEQFQSANPNGVTYTIDADVVREFQKYLDQCRASGIKVILVYSPEYIESQRMTHNHQKLISLYRSIADDEGIPFLDYSDNPISMDKANFYNSQHLNAKGAERFSIELAARLRSILNNGHT